MYREVLRSRGIAVGGQAEGGPVPMAAGRRRAGARPAAARWPSGAAALAVARPLRTTARCSLFYCSCGRWSIRSIDIPQANSIERVLAALAVLGDGCATAAQIAVALGGLDPRHGDYYGHALRILGLADYAGGQALRTTLGSQLATLPPEAQRTRLRVLVAATSPMREVLAALDAATPAGCTLDELTALVQRLAPLSPATARRRAQAVLAWLHDLQLAAPAGGCWRRVVDQQLEAADPAVAAWLHECGVAAS